MVETDKVIAGKVARRVRLRWSWVLAAALLVSVAANLNFANRVLYLDTNHPFHPVCFTEADGLVVLTGHMNERFKELTLTDWTYSKRLGTDKVIYISLRDWKRDQDGIWNQTWKTAVYIYFERTGKKLSSKEMFDMRTSHCKFIRKYVLEKPKTK